MEKEDKELLRDLMLTPSPSGEEKECMSVLGEWMTRYTDGEVYSDKLGNKAWKLGNGDTKILLSAHIDEVCARVLCIGENGEISLINVAGIDKKSLLGNEVLVESDSGQWIRGVCEKKPLHLEEEDDKLEFKNLRVNLGYQKREDIEALGVHPGSCVIYPRRAWVDFGKSEVCGCGLDDKSGIWVVSEIAKRLSGHLEEIGEKYTIIFGACTQEETGLRGACRLAANLNPDLSIDFDVTFATDGDLGVDKNECGEVKLGSGPVLEWGPDKSSRLNKILKKVAIDSKIPYQEVASRCGGTNTARIQLMSKDCETTLVSIPNRSMHSPVEVCSWIDLEGIVDMVVGAILSEEM